MKLICGWCGKEFNANVIKDKYGERTPLVCPHCARLLPSSRKDSTGSLVQNKHIHIEWKNGDVVI